MKQGIREFKLKEALQLLRERKITVWRAVEMADATYRENLDSLKRYNIPFPATLEEIKREIKEIKGSYPEAPFNSPSQNWPPSSS